jgi:hypothetical protein
MGIIMRLISIPFSSTRRFERHKTASFIYLKITKLLLIITYFGEELCMWLIYPIRSWV